MTKRRLINIVILIISVIAIILSSFNVKNDMAWLSVLCVGLIFLITSGGILFYEIMEGMNNDR